MSNSLGSLTLDLVAKIGGFTQQMDRAASATEKSMKQIEVASNQAKLAINSMFAIAAGGFSINSLKNAADSFTELNNRLKLVTSSSDELSVAQEAIYKISQTTSQSLNSTAQVYQRFAQNAKELGINQQQVADLTTTVSKAIALSGASTGAAEAALVQFGQALNSGVLRGDEFNSVMEQTPGLAKALADGLGVPIGQLRALANDGKLTTDQLIKALNNAANGIDKQFSTITKTVGQAFTNLGNAFTTYIGKADQAAGISQGLSQAILFLSENLDTVFNAGLLIAGTRLGALTVSLGEAAVASINSTRASLSEAAARRESTLATIADTKAKIADIQSERAFAIAVQQSLAAQLQAAQAEAARTAIRQQMKTNSAQIVALTNAETAATTKLAAAQSSVAGLGRSLFTALGGLSGIGAVAGLAATAISLYASSGEKAHAVNIDLSQSTEKVRQELEKLSKSKLILQTGDFEKKIEQAKNSYQDLTRQIAREINPNFDINPESYNVFIGKIQEQADKVFLNGGDVEDFLSALKQSMNLTNEQVNSIRALGVEVSETGERYRKNIGWLETTRQLIQGATVDTKQLGQAANEALNPQQLKGYNKIIEDLDRQILALRDKTGLETLKIELGKTGVKEGTKEWDDAIAKLKERNKARDDQSSFKSTIKSENDLARAYQSQVEQLTKQLVVIDNKNEAQKLAYELEYGSLTKLNQAQRDTLEALAFEVDLRNEVAKAAKAQAEQYKWINALNADLDNKRSQINLDIDSVGMGKRQFEDYKDIIDIQKKYADQQRELAKKLGTPNGLSQSDYDNRVLALQNLMDKDVAITIEGQNRKKEAERDWLNGAKSSYQDYLDEANNVAKQTDNLFTNAFGNMENALVSFVRTGKLSFKSFANSVLDDLARIGVRMATSSALQAVFGSALGGLFGNYAGASKSLDGMVEYSPLFGFQANAKGGVYDVSGIKTFAKGGAFTNAIVDKPTLFPFAKGTGLMGEAGPEAIMPLTRTSDGSLGVRMVSEQLGSNGRTTNPQVNIVINNDGSGSVTTSQGYEQMGQEMYRQIQAIADERIMYQKQQGGVLDPNSRR